MNKDSHAEEPNADWLSFVDAQAGSERSELPLASIRPGDRVLIKTRNTHYLFAWKTPDLSLLRASNTKAPSGPVRIMGCSFGLSSSIRPDALFCGGNLEFTHSNGEKTWTTSTIEEIHLLHESATSQKLSP